MATLLRSILVILLAGTAVAASAQDHRLLPVEDPTSQAIVRLQQRGLLLRLHPTAAPYRFGEIREALAEVDESALAPEEARWVRLLHARLGPERPAGSAEAGLTLLGSTIVSTNERLDPVRYLDTGEPELQSGGLTFYPDWGLQLYTEAGPTVAQLGLRGGFLYKDDPDALPVVKRFMTRSEESYIGVHSRYATVYAGRYHQHWGVPGEPAVQISSNPRMYDHLSLRLGGDRLALRSILGELDSITLDDRYTGRVGDLREGGKRRFVAGHRFDWRPTRNFALSFVETALYSGTGATMSPHWLIPTINYIVEIDNQPKNVEVKGLIGGHIWWNLQGWTLHGHLLIDDVDLEQPDEPISAALTGSLTRAGLRPFGPDAALSSVDLSAELEVVTARTYNTHQIEGQYLYMMRGLATQFSDYILMRYQAALHLEGVVPGLTVQPELQLLWQGEEDIRNPFPDNDEAPAILDGTVERTARLGTRIHLQSDPRWWLSANLGVNRTWNDRHEAGADRTRFVGWIEGGVRLNLRTTFGLDL